MSNTSWVEALVRESIADRGYEGITDERIAKVVSDLFGNNTLGQAYDMVDDHILEVFGNEDGDSPFEGIGNYELVQFINKHGIAVDTFLPEHKLRAEYISCIKEEGKLEAFIAECSPAPKRAMGDYSDAELLALIEEHNLHDQVEHTDNELVLRMRMIIALRGHKIIG